MRAPAAEILSNASLLEDATDIFLIDSPLGMLPEGAALPVDSQVIANAGESAEPRMRHRTFSRTGTNRIVSVLADPIVYNGEMLGTLIAVYDPMRDGYLKDRLKNGAQIYWQDADQMVSLTPEAEPSTTNASTEPTRNSRIDEALFSFPALGRVQLTGFPQLSYAASSHGLTEKRQALKAKLALIGTVMLGMAVFLSTVLARKISLPLQTMVDQAMAISGEPGSRFFDIDGTRYAELQKLAEGFNALLRNLIRSRETERKAKNFLDAIISTAADPIFVKDGKFRWVVLNDAYCRFVGKSRQALIGATDFDFFPDKEAHFFRQQDQHVFETGTAHAYESKMTDAAGDIHHIFVKKNLYEDPESKEKFIVGIIRDITRSKQLEAEVARHRDQLTEMVAERTAELMTANEHLLREIEERRKAERERKEIETQLRRARQMEAIGTLAGGVAHDLNNILSGVVSYPDLILMDLPKENPLHKPIATIQRSGKKAAAIVQDLLTLARRGTAASDPVDLSELVGEYLESPEHQNFIKDHPLVTVETALEARLPMVIGSAVHLSKTVMNLTTNAVEAIDGDGRVTIATARATIDTPLAAYESIPAGQYVVLRVSDSGSGIDNRDMERIFEPFFTRKKLGRSGTGLGMAVVWGTVKDHQGFIDVRSNPGEGSTFTLYFPMGVPADNRRDTSRQRRCHRGRGERILIVDDVADQREIASAMIRQLGYRVWAEESGEAAVERIRHDTFDLILLDMIMDPGIDGYETYRRIMAIRPDQRAIITSGFSESARVRRLKALGVTTCLKKPYTMEQLAAAMRVELDRS